MEYNDFSWERHKPLTAGSALSVADVETMTKLMIELREVTLSRKSYLAATAFLKRFGHDTDPSSLVSPESFAN